MRVAVVGAGVSGLTCGVRLLEEGHKVRVVARDLPPRTTSAVAGAVWFPYRVAPNERTGPWAEASYRRFAELAGDPAAPVSMVELTMLYPEPLREEPWWLDAVPDKRVRPCTRQELPIDYGDGRVLQVPSIEAPAYLDWLTRRLTELGGKIQLQTVERIDDLPEPVVVNCPGASAGDATPVRGQIAYVRSTRALRFMIDEEGPNALAYILPRADVVVLGGTAEEGDTDLTPREQTTKEILAKTRRMQPELAHATFVGAAVGLRPARPTVRLDSEQTPGGKLVVHDYGHGGSGFTLSWGCADEVAAIVSASETTVT